MSRKQRRRRLKRRQQRRPIQKTRRTPSVYEEAIPVASLSDTMRHHLDLLGRGTVEDYLDWCRVSKFACHLHKDTDERAVEVERHVSAGAKVRYRAHVRRPATVLLAMLDAACGAEDMPSVAETPAILGPVRDFFLHPRNGEHKRTFVRRLLLHVLRESRELLFEPVSSGDRSTAYIVGILRLADFHDQALRDMANWRPRTRNLGRQFRSLLDHLLAKWPVPECLANAFLTQGDDAETRKHRDWFVHLGNGQSIRTASALPLELSRKMAHHFPSAPADYSVTEALRWAQIHGLGGDARLAAAVRGTFLTRSFENDSFWAGVLRYFIVNPSLVPAHVGPVVDYLNEMRFVRGRLLNGDDQVVDTPPAHPELNMSRRCPSQLLRQIVNWSTDFGQRVRESNRLRNAPLPAINLPDYRHEEGSARRGNRKVWRIRQLLSADDLVAEGRRMRHCVATYTKACSRVRCSIWSMTVVVETGCAPVLTIEVDPRTRRIRQARGYQNADPTPEQQEVLRRWADQAKLEIVAWAWD